MQDKFYMEELQDGTYKATFNGLEVIAKTAIEAITQVFKLDKERSEQNGNNQG